ncbi:MAG TPA: PAS domain S-box protein [Sphingobium sp.]
MPLALRLIVAVLIVAATAALHKAAQPWLDERTTFLPYTLSVLLIVIGAGPIAAMVGAVMALLCGVFLIGGGMASMETSDSLEAAIFLIISGAIILLAERINRSRLDALESDRRAEQRATEAGTLAEELNLLIDGVPRHAIYMVDPGGHVTLWNRGAERLKGWTEAEVLGQPMTLFYPQDAIDAGKPTADLAVAARDGRLEEEDWRLRRDGSEFLAAVTITALRDAGGAVRGFAKIVSDITEQRATDTLLRSQESHLRSILSTVPDAMVVIDKAGIIVSFSAAAETLFGYREEEVVGENVAMLMPSPDRERHDAYIGRYRETHEKRIIGIGRVVFARRKDGGTFPVELSIGETTAEGTEPLFTGFMRDLTERYRTEARLEALQSELIHVSRLSAMGTMASTLAHELNQPITAIAAYAEAVRDQLADPDPQDMEMIREALDDTAKEALRAGHIVRRLREFVARGEVEKTVEPLPQLINEAAVLGLIGAREQGVEPLFDLDPYASPVLVDKVQIQQVLINLIRNAVEAMGGVGAESGSPERRLTITSRADDNPACVRVTVADTGPGVLPHVAAKLFTAFVTSKTGGMGLGLSICRTIVEANGGRIWMEPRPGGGSQFHFTLLRAQIEGGGEGS